MSAAPTVLVVVTGGSRGIGRAVATAAPDGSEVVDVSRTGGTPGTTHLRADLAEPASWRQVGDAIAERVAARAWHRVVLVHAAGMLAPIGFAGEVDAEAYTTNVLVNAAAGQAVGHRFLAAVRDLDARRQLCWLTSGESVTLGWSAYKSAKVAAAHWVRTVGAEQAERGGTEVCGIAPGVVATDMQELIRSTSARDFPRVDHFRRLHDEGRLADPDDVAERIWRVLDGPVEPGTVLDLRELSAGGAGDPGR